MLSFEISAIDVVLMVAMLILLVLFVTQRKSQSMAEPRLSINPQQKLSEEPEVKKEITVEDRLDKPSANNFRGCIHQFGHLKGMSENTPIPDECFGCPKVLRCMFRNE